MPKYIEMEAEISVRSDAMLGDTPAREEQNEQEKDMPDNSGQ